MGLNKSQVTPNIKPNQNLWRYTSLDNLIDLLSKKKLFFTPLYWYAKTDPFEGLLPKIGLNAIRDIVSSLSNQEKERRKKVEDYFLGTVSEQYHAEIRKNLNDMGDIKYQAEEMIFKIFKSTVINCWHQNESESEAMWRLYSDNKKVLPFRQLQKI